MRWAQLAARAVLSIGSVVAVLAMTAKARTDPPRAASAPTPESRKLTAGEAGRAKELEAEIEVATRVGGWGIAIAKAEELLALRMAALGPRHPRARKEQWRLDALRRIATLPTADRIAYRSITRRNDRVTRLLSEGKHVAAQPFLETAMESRRRLLGEDHPDIAIIYNNLALDLDNRGKYAEAQPLHAKALEIDRRALGEDHPDTATSYNNLAVNLDHQGRYAEARPLYAKALEIDRRALGEDDPSTAIDYNNLADNFCNQGRYAEAQPLFEKALEIERRTLGEAHPDTALSYHNLALNLDSQAKYAEAQPLFEKALEIERRALGEDDPSIAITYDNLADNLDHQGKHAEAQLLLEKALEIERRTLGGDHPETGIGYHNLAVNLDDQEKYAEAEPLYAKALEIERRALGEDHPEIALTYDNLADNLGNQGRYAEALPFFEKALEIQRRALGEEHPDTALTYENLANSLDAQGRYAEALEHQQRAVRALDTARLHQAFTGMERAGTGETARITLAAGLARLGRPVAAWHALEDDFGRGLLDELAARRGRRLSRIERDRLDELTSELERLDALVQSPPGELDRGERARRFEDLKHRRELASIALGEFHARLARDHGPVAGRVAGLEEIQSALAADAALVAWVDLAPYGPNAADPDGHRWGVVVRSRGRPAWVPLPGTGRNGLWTVEDIRLAGRVRQALRARPGVGPDDLRLLVERLRGQRLDPLAAALGAADGLPPARRLIVLPSRSLAGIPVEALLDVGDTRTVSYAPSATVLKYLRERPRPDRGSGLLALGDPVYEVPDASGEPGPMPDHGLLVNFIVPGSNADAHGLRVGDVLLAYNGTPLKRSDDLTVVPGRGRAVSVEVWRDGRIERRELDAGKLGVVVDSRPAPQAIAEDRDIDKVPMASRSGGEDFLPLPGTRFEAEAIGEMFRTDHRPARVLLGAEDSEPELERLAASGALRRFAFLHLAAHGVIDESIPARSAVILSQAGLPDPLEQALANKPVFDGRLSVREIQRGWELDAELVTLSACETALGRQAGGEGFVGFTQALLMSGARSICLSLWKVDDTATALLMRRFYANLLGRRDALSAPMPKAEALREAKLWLRGLKRSEALAVAAELSGGVERGKGAKARHAVAPTATIPAGRDDDRPYAAPHYWAAFVLVGDPD